MASEETIGTPLPPEDDQASPAVEPEAAVTEAVGTTAEPEAVPTDQQSEPAAAKGRPSELVELKEGMRMRGRVRNIVPFGAFVDLGVGRDGLAHISTLQRAGIDKTLKVGDMLDVQIRRVDLERNRISLTVPGAGRTNKQPLEALKAGQEVTGRVVRMVEFGAFVDIGAQTDGLLHISQLSGGYVNHPREVVELGQEVTVRILEVDTERRRISLTMKDLEEAEEEVPAVPAPAQAPEDRGPSVFAAAWQEALRDRNRRRARR
ncbi:MAG: S1 RNA-binding domain-containing protein [Anaerolineae bacterium]|jgi:small subunit ribosomal protein S1|nr:S1 RNA-binding domain-containing protein [Chloroflexota bacterium]